MSRIKKVLFKFWFISLTKLKSFDKQTVVFEGGIGSQILSFIEYKEKTKNLRIPISANFDYFLNVTEDFVDKYGLSRWAWKLDHYGIKQSDMSQNSKIKKLVNKYLRVRQSNRSEIFYNFRESKSASYIDLFPVQQTKINAYLQSIFESRKDQFCVIHVRRGDYLKVASKVTTLEEVCKLIEKIRYLIPNNILIASDSELNAFEKLLLDQSLLGFKYFYIDPKESPFLVHDLMRASKVLIASNSTFSFSAGLLANDDCLIFFPTKYFGEGSAQDSQAFIFRQPFDYLFG
jgi:hypothetical protein